MLDHTLDRVLEPSEYSHSDIVRHAAVYVASTHPQRGTIHEPLDWDLFHLRIEDQEFHEVSLEQVLNKINRYIKSTSV